MELFVEFLGSKDWSIVVTSKVQIELTTKFWYKKKT